MGRPKKPTIFAKGKNVMLDPETNDLQINSTLAIKETTKKRTYTSKKPNKLIASLEKDANIEEVTQAHDYNREVDSSTRMESQTESEVEDSRLNLSTNTLLSKSKNASSKRQKALSEMQGKQDIQEASMENKKKRRITPRWEKTPATIAETESHEMPTACHNQGVVLQEKQLDSKGYIDINHLRLYDRDWRIIVIVLRRGVVEPYTTAKGSGTMWKVILMDEQGTSIQAIMFNEAIDVLDQWFLRERTYFISNGLVKPVNPKYASAHKEIEIGLSIHTQVEEAKMSIKLDRFKYDFIPLQDVNDSIKSNGIIADVLDLVIDVEPLSEVSKAGGVGKSKKRSVTLINSSCESILLTLWGDMATNEGDMLEKMKTKRPIVALSKVKISTYAGVLSMSTISITTLQVDPSIPETDAVKKRFNHNLQKTPGTTSSGKNKETAERVKISDVMERSLLEFQVLTQDNSMHG